MRRKKKPTNRESSAKKADDLPLSAEEVGVGILGFNLLDNSPGWRGVGDIAARASGHARVENADHITHAIDDERARVALGGEIAGLVVVVVDCEFSGLLPKIIAEVGLQARAPSHGEIARVSVLHYDEAGLAVAVETVGIEHALARDETGDPELAIGGEFEHRPTVIERVEHVGEIPGRILGS
jgi:hypothetical protein